MAKKKPFIGGAVRGHGDGWLTREKGPGPVGDAGFLRVRGSESTWFELLCPVQSCSFITRPESALVTMSWSGQYSANAEGLRLVGNLWKRCRPAPPDRRFGDCTRIVTIEGMAYVMVLDGGVFRMDVLDAFTPIDATLPRSVHLKAIAGTAGDRIFVVGSKGAFWRYDGKKWAPIKTPTGVNLAAVTCGENGDVWVAGRAGTLLCWRDRKWETIAPPQDAPDLWGVAWFERKLYAASLTNVFVLEKRGLVPVKFGKDAPSTCGALTVGSDAMWSIGSHDVMELHKKRWTRIARA